MESSGPTLKCTAGVTLKSATRKNSGTGGVSKARGCKQTAAAAGPDWSCQTLRPGPAPGRPVNLISGRSCPVSASSFEGRGEEISRNSFPSFPDDPRISDPQRCAHPSQLHLLALKLWSIFTSLLTVMQDISHFCQILFSHNWTVGFSRGHRVWGIPRG